MADQTELRPQGHACPQAEELLTARPAQDQLQGGCVWLRQQVRRALDCRALFVSRKLHLIALGPGSGTASTSDLSRTSASIHDFTSDWLKHTETSNGAAELEGPPCRHLSLGYLNLTHMAWQQRHPCRRPAR